MTKSTSRDFLESILRPNIELSLSLLDLVESTRTDDPTARYQIAAIITFLSGIDKVLSFFYQLLYISGQIEWNNIAPNKNKIPIGYIECQWGLTKKVFELEKYGVDITDLLEIIELRNMYMHDSYLYAGYALDLDAEGQAYLGARGITYHTVSPPITFFTPNFINYYKTQIIQEVSEVLDSIDWFSNWQKVSQKLEKLPKNPEPEFSQLSEDFKNINEIINSLNEKYIGQGASMILDDLNDNVYS